MNELDKKLDAYLESAFDKKLDELLAERERHLNAADVPNYKLVTPKEKEQLKGLLAYYAKKPHPFTACVRDNRKRFGPRAEGVCAVLKDLIRGTTRWRGKNNPRDHGTAGLALPEADESVLDLIESLGELDLWTLMGLAELEDSEPAEPTTDKD